ncbi:MAG: hypothetical protein JNG84_06815 [Archangium sp.]|nr:hypothetical protein [Archangium sp.]
MVRQFAIVRVKPQVTRWEFPVAHDELTESPLAGPLSRRAMATVEQVMDSLPTLRRVDPAQTRWSLARTSWDRVDVWLTSDGGLYVSSTGPLLTVAAIVNELAHAVGGLVAEDCTHGVLHSPETLLQQLEREADVQLPWPTPPGWRAAA